MQGSQTNTYYFYMYEMFYVAPDFILARSEVPNLNFIPCVVSQPTPNTQEAF